MILNALQDSARIEPLHPLFKKLFDYVKTHDLTKVEPGRITLDGESLYINVCDATLCGKEEQKLEVHRRYIDVHFPLGGTETIGWRDLKSIAAPSEAPFDEDGDFALYACPAATYLTVRPGEFCVMYPEDAHAPVIGKGSLRKAIAKVRL